MPLAAGVEVAVVGVVLGLDDIAAEARVDNGSVRDKVIGNVNRHILTKRCFGFVCVPKN